MIDNKRKRRHVVKTEYFENDSWLDVVPLRLGQSHPPIEALSLVTLIYKHQAGVVEHGHIVVASLLK